MVLRTPADDGAAGAAAEATAATDASVDACRRAFKSTAGACVPRGALKAVRTTMALQDAASRVDRSMADHRGRQAERRRAGRKSNLKDRRTVELLPRKQLFLIRTTPY
jgi:hypothetical protein